MTRTALRTAALVVAGSATLGLVPAPATPPQKQLSRNRLKGFTLIELIVVVVIIGVLSSIAALGYNAFVDRSRTTALKATALQAEKAISAQTARADTFDAATVDAAAGNVSGATLSAFSGGYVKVVPTGNVTRAACLNFGPNPAPGSHTIEITYGDASLGCAASNGPGSGSGLGSTGSPSVDPATLNDLTFVRTATGYTVTAHNLLDRGLSAGDSVLLADEEVRGPSNQTQARPTQYFFQDQGAGVTAVYFFGGAATVQSDGTATWQMPKFHWEAFNGAPNGVEPGATRSFLVGNNKGDHFTGGTLAFPYEAGDTVWTPPVPAPVEASAGTAPAKWNVTKTASAYKITVADLPPSTKMFFTASLAGAVGSADAAMNQNYEIDAGAGYLDVVVTKTVTTDVDGTAVFTLPFGHMDGWDFDAEQPSGKPAGIEPGSTIQAAVFESGYMDDDLGHGTVTFS